MDYVQLLPIAAVCHVSKPTSQAFVRGETPSKERIIVPNAYARPRMDDENGGRDGKGSISWTIRPRTKPNWDPVPMPKYEKDKDLSIFQHPLLLWYCSLYRDFL